MLQEAVADQPRYVLPVVVPLVGDLFLQHGADGNDRSKSVAKEQELQEEFTAQNAVTRGESDRNHPAELDDRCE